MITKKSIEALQVHAIHEDIHNEHITSPLQPNSNPQSSSIFTMITRNPIEVCTTNPCSYILLTMTTSHIHCNVLSVLKLIHEYT
jgi:hypothetical protein